MQSLILALLLIAGVSSGQDLSPVQESPLTEAMFAAEDPSTQGMDSAQLEQSTLSGLTALCGLQGNS